MEKKEIEIRTKKLEAAMQIMRRNIMHYQKTDELKNAERHLLWMLYSLTCECAHVKPTDLAKKLDISMSAVTHMINSLDQSGMIKRISDETDRRVVLLELTAKGKEKIETVKKHYWKKLTSMVTYLGDEDSAKFIEIITKISKFNDNLTD